MLTEGSCFTTSLSLLGLTIGFTLHSIHVILTCSSGDIVFLYNPNSIKLLSTLHNLVISIKLQTTHTDMQNILTNV